MVCCGEATYYVTLLQKYNYIPDLVADNHIIFDIEF